ncbi:Uu.00g061890.m01.CDS01 [Anthostomella pinea]|uniref:Uu.00g061890.m01.CDS01 n=1 Tax=Anthostomella pinea TaxID=933095 RepID=A0AAI8VTD9_9PEZI|nr:Uu.00g061890.m01.CDS01 [Anthostomella pinea]
MPASSPKPSKFPPTAPTPGASGASSLRGGPPQPLAPAQAAAGTGGSLFIPLEARHNATLDDLVMNTDNNICYELSQHYACGHTSGINELLLSKRHIHQIGYGQACNGCSVDYTRRLVLPQRCPQCAGIEECLSVTMKHACGHLAGVQVSPGARHGRLLGAQNACNSFCKSIQLDQHIGGGCLQCTSTSCAMIWELYQCGHRGGVAAQHVVGHHHVLYLGSSNAACDARCQFEHKDRIVGDHCAKFPNSMTDQQTAPALTTRAQAKDFRTQTVTRPDLTFTTTWTLGGGAGESTETPATTVVPAPKASGPRPDSVGAILSAVVVLVVVVLILWVCCRRGRSPSRRSRSSSSRRSGSSYTSKSSSSGSGRSGGSSHQGGSAGSVASEMIEEQWDQGQPMPGMPPPVAGGWAGPHPGHMGTPPGAGMGFQAGPGGPPPMLARGNGPPPGFGGPPPMMSRGGPPPPIS